MFVGLRICGSEANNVASSPGYRSSCETALAASREDWARLVETAKVRQPRHRESRGKNCMRTVIIGKVQCRGNAKPAWPSRSQARRQGLFFSSFAPPKPSAWPSAYFTGTYETTTTTIPEVLSGLDRWGGPVTRCFRGEKSQTAPLPDRAFAILAAGHVQGRVA